MFHIPLVVGMLIGASNQAQAKPLEGNKYLRAVALDLIARPPTPEEYSQMDSGSELPMTLIDEWLESEDFLAETVKGIAKDNDYNLVISNRDVIAGENSLDITDDTIRAMNAQDVTIPFEIKD